MVQLQMSPTQLGNRVTLGPAPWYRVERHELREGPTERLVGQLRNHQWSIDGHHFAAVHASRSKLHFERGGDATPQFGPFEQLHMSDGALYGDGELIARFDDDTYLWRCAKSQQAWPSIVVSSH